MGGGEGAKPSLLALRQSAQQMGDEIEALQRKLAAERSRSATSTTKPAGKLASASETAVCPRTQALLREELVTELADVYATLAERNMRLQEITDVRSQCESLEHNAQTLFMLKSPTSSPKRVP